jgi:Zn finger protein HypA/HybF involved in hydrogenase expression
MKIPFLKNNKKVYYHLCLTCNKEFHYNEKNESCSVCGKKFNRVFEYISVRSTGGFDIYGCDTCKIRFETKQKDCPCPKCAKTTVYAGHVLNCGDPSYFRRLLVWIGQF